LKIDKSSNWIQRFLLGELAEADRTAIERELLADRERFEQVCSVEDDLIDAYLRGNMAREVRERFESHYLASQYNRERVATARILIANINRMASETVKNRKRETEVSWLKRFSDFIQWRRLATVGVLVMTLVFALGSFWLYLERARLSGQIVTIQNEAQIERSYLKQREQELSLQIQKLEAEIANERQLTENSKATLNRLRQQQSSPTPAILTLLLTPTPIRDEKAPPSLTLPLLNGKVRLLMELNSDSYSSYQIRLQTAEGRGILNGNAVKVRFGKDREFAALTILTGKLTKGDYILILSGKTADGRDEEIDQYYFRVS
jgi:hypothetical protein